MGKGGGSSDQELEEVSQKEVNIGNRQLDMESIEVTKISKVGDAVSDFEQKIREIDRELTEDIGGSNLNILKSDTINLEVPLEVNCDANSEIVGDKENLGKSDGCVSVDKGRKYRGSKGKASAFQKTFLRLSDKPKPQKIPFSLLNVIKTFPMPPDRAWKKMKSPSSSSSSSSSSEECRNWLDLPRDVTVSILQRLGTIEILETAQKVCTLWRNISKDPSMWNSIDMRNLGDLHDMEYDLEKMCIHAIDRSCGHLQDINIEYFGTDKLLAYITQSSSQLRRLRLVCCYSISDGGLSKVAAKLSLLEELDITLCSLSKESLEVVGRCCPLLKSFKWNQQWYAIATDGLSQTLCDEEAVAIAKNMPELRHLQLIGNQLTNDGLQAILDGCPHLESLDLRKCFNFRENPNPKMPLKKVWKKKEALPPPPPPPPSATSSSSKKQTKKVWRKKKETTRNWLELPRDVTASILHRLGAVEILETAQKVCTLWRSLCKDPSMWRAVDMRNTYCRRSLGDPINMRMRCYLDKMCIHAIDRSFGQLLDINIENFGSDDLLTYIAQSSSQLRRLRLLCCDSISEKALREAAAKLPLLEELGITLFLLPKESLEAVGHCCPLLKSLKWNQKWDAADKECDEEAVAIAKNMPELHHLQLIGNQLTNDGLQAILDGCPHLESLDLRRCFNLRSTALRHISGGRMAIFPFVKIEHVDVAPMEVSLQICATACTPSARSRGSRPPESLEDRPVTSSQLRCLRLLHCYEITDEGLIEMAENLPLLEELDITISSLSEETIEAVGRCCPHLKSFKWNHEGYRFPDIQCDEEAVAIAKNMPKLRHLQLIGNRLTNDGLQAILDNCPHLESLDLRKCFNVTLSGDLGRRCARIKNLRLPNDSTNDCGFIVETSDIESFEQNIPFWMLDIDDLSDDYGCYYDSDLSYDDYFRKYSEDWEYFG
ncbi:f-box protein skip19 [Quercus suber]|uniref:F-box protein skip19 n=1 Tax=Quercus suber TaxID=58331 RepID=A0AAW0LP63_QUESU